MLHSYPSARGTARPLRRSPTTRTGPARALTSALILLAVACGGDASVDPLEVRNLSLTVEPTKLFLAEGQDGRLYAQLVDDAGLPVPMKDLSWSSSDPAVATVDDLGIVSGVATGSVTITATANGKKDKADVNVKGKGKLELHMVSGNGQTGPVGETLPLPLVVEVRDRTGAGMSGIDVEWSVSGEGGTTSAASTTTNQNGLTQVLWTMGRVAGQQALEAQVQGAGAVDFGATGTPGAPASVSLAPSSVSLEVGGQQQFAATARDRFGNTVPGASFIWTSTAGDVVNVDGAGMAKAMAAGSATVEATADAAHGAAHVDVTGGGSGVPGTVKNLAVRSTTATTATLAFTQVENGSGSPADYDVRFAATSGDFRWDEAVSVQNGTCATPVEGSQVGQELACSVGGLSPSTTYEFLVVALGNGSSGEPSNVANGTTASSSVGVESVAVDPESHIFTALNQSLAVQATAYDASGGVVPDVGFTWSSSDPDVATVNQTGLVVARAVGTATIVATALCCQNPSASLAVTVDAVPASVAISPSTFEVELGGTRALTAEVLDTEGNVLTGALVTWTSSDPTVAPVDPAGVVTGLTLGNATIVAEAGVAASSASGTVVEVSEVVPTAIEVSPASFSLEVGQTRQLAATVLDSEGNVVNGVEVEWSSSAPAVASVSSSGLVQAVAVGPVTLEAAATSVSGLVGQSSLTVVEEGPQNATYPHEPAGMSQVFRTDGTENRFSGAWTYYNGWDKHARVVDDASNPIGTGKVLELVTPAGGRGAGIAALSHFETGPHSELYIMYRVFYDPTLDTNGTNSGKQFYLGMHEKARNNSSGPTQLYFVSRVGSGTGGGGGSMFTQQNASPTNNPLTCFSGCPARFVTGKWQEFEIHLTAQSSPSVADGVIRIWVNGTFVGENTKVRFVNPDDADTRFDGLEWYFWTNDTSPDGDWERIGEFYISGRK